MHVRFSDVAPEEELTTVWNAIGGVLSILYKCGWLAIYFFRVSGSGTNCSTLKARQCAFYLYSKEGARCNVYRIKGFSAAHNTDKLNLTITEVLGFSA